MAAYSFFLRPDPYNSLGILGQADSFTEREIKMGWTEWGIFAGVLVAWVVMVRWVLPWFGIQTCCCAAKQCSTTAKSTVSAGDAGSEEKSQHRQGDVP